MNSINTRMKTASSVYVSAPCGRTSQGHMSLMGRVAGIADVDPKVAFFAATAEGPSAWSPPQH